MKLELHAEKDENENVHERACIQLKSFARIAFYTTHTKRYFLSPNTMKRIVMENVKLVVFVLILCVG